MFVAVARVTLSIPESGSLKSKRQVLRKVIDRVRARFNVAISEVGDQDLWQKAVIGVAAVANEGGFAQESVDKVVRFIEEMYVAPVIDRQTEVIPMGGDLYGKGDLSHLHAAMERPHRTLAEAEAEAEERFEGEEEFADAFGDDGREPEDERRAAPAMRTLADAEREQREPPRRNRRGGDRDRDRDHRGGYRQRQPMTEEERERAIAELRERVRAGLRNRDDDDKD